MASPFRPAARRGRVSATRAWCLSPLLSLLLPLGACTVDTGSQPAPAMADAGAPALPPQEVHYRLAWNTDGVTLAPPAAGDGASDASGDGAADTPIFALTNDLGVAFEVTRGWLVSYSFEATVCPADTTRASVLQRVWVQLVENVGVRSVWAGHGSLPVSPAQLRASYVEDLRDVMKPAEVGAVVLPHHRLYGLHLLLGRADDRAPALPTEVDMLRQTLHLQGRWRTLGQTTWTPFTWRTAVGWGEVHTLAAPHDTAWGGLELSARRTLASLVDHIDPSVMTEANAARQVLENVVAGVRVEATPHLH